MSTLEGVRGLLLDIDGTLLVDDRPIAGAPETLMRLRAAGLPVRLMTNTSRRSRAAIARALRSAGLEASVPEILTPADIAGGPAAGCRTALVRTGKGAGAPSPPGGPRPDSILESIADLP